MNTDKHKYKKYKRKYLELRRVTSNDEFDLDSLPIKEPFDGDNFRGRGIDWYLFFDLLQVSKDVINLTNKDDIIILVGDTPSYLEPFVKKYRKVFNLAFSGKAFGCFYPMYGKPHEWSDIKNPKIKNVADIIMEPPINDPYVPTLQELNTYFDYLDNKTDLTKSFIQKNWTKIILVDSSSGQSIHGTSIFFNRYVGNINQNSNIKCTEINGSQALQFIRLDEGNYKTTNINASKAENFFGKENRSVINYRPDLIIYIGSSYFYHRQLFMIHEAYPRIVPFYSVGFWKNPPRKVQKSKRWKIL